MPARSRFTALVLAALVASALMPAAAFASTRAKATFAEPAEQTYHVVGRNYKVSWTESSQPVERKLTEEKGPVDVDGGCSKTKSWAVTRVFFPSSASKGVKLARDACYRFTVALKSGDGTLTETVSPTVRTLSAWTGVYNLYRTGVFASQKKWDYCVAASIQMMFNIIRNESRTGLTNQTMYYNYSRSVGLQPLSVPGADPRGWARTLADKGGGNYKDVSSSSFASGLKKAVKRMRLTGKPAGLIVENGDHAWVLNGFEASADPAVTDSFSVTAAYIMGPWYPRPKDGLTLDKAPNTRYSMTALKKKFTAYNDPFGSAKWSVWEGTYVTINP